jgi:hypothetical protein
MSEQTTLEEAIWAGDVDRLYDLAPCKCCCADHTFSNCPARQWNGCRGQDSEQYDSKKWFEFYKATRGMTEAEFYGIDGG